IADIVAYLDDTDLVQTILQGIDATNLNQVIQLMSRRAARPTLNLDTFQGDATALAAFKASLAAQIPAGDNDFFTRFIDFETTGRGAALAGVGQEDSGNLVGDEWQDYGVVFRALDALGAGSTDLMALKARSTQQAGSSFASGALAQAIPDNPATSLES